MHVLVCVLFTRAVGLSSIEVVCGSATNDVPLASLPIHRHASENNKESAHRFKRVDWRRSTKVSSLVRDSLSNFLYCCCCLWYWFPRSFYLSYCPVFLFFIFCCCSYFLFLPASCLFRVALSPSFLSLSPCTCACTFINSALLCSVLSFVLLLFLSVVFPLSLSPCLCSFFFKCDHLLLKEDSLGLLLDILSSSYIYIYTRIYDICAPVCARDGFFFACWAASLLLPLLVVLLWYFKQETRARSRYSFAVCRHITVVTFPVPLPSPPLPVSVCACVCERFSARSVTHSSAKRLDTFSPPCPPLSPRILPCVLLSLRVGGRTVVFLVHFLFYLHSFFLFCAPPPPNRTPPPSLPLFLSFETLFVRSPPPTHNDSSYRLVQFRRPSHIVFPSIFTLHPVSCLRWPSDLFFFVFFSCVPFVFLSPVTGFSASLCMCVWGWAATRRSLLQPCVSCLLPIAYMFRGVLLGLAYSFFFLVLSFIVYVDLGLIHFCFGLLSFC